MKNDLFEDNDYNKCEQVIANYWGNGFYTRIVMKLIEEMSELTQILLKEMDGERNYEGVDVPELVQRETADVLRWLQYLMRFRQMDKQYLVDYIAKKSRKVIKKYEGKVRVENTTDK